jgi:NAD(P)-dependent dehydrogenase (short-subunit alcohol dehydrogenase family)
MDAIIHNAGVYAERDRNPTPEGHARVLAVNTLAPYLMTGLIERPARLIYFTAAADEVLVMLALPCLLAASSSVAALLPGR